MPEPAERLLQKLENLVRKVKVLSQGASEVDCRVFAPPAPGEPFVVEVSKDRFVRRVTVDEMTVERLRLGQPDPFLMRDLRTAILTVSRFAQRRS